MRQHDAEIIANALLDAFGAKHRAEGPAFLEGLSVALAGWGLKEPVGPALNRIAEGVERLASAMEKLRS